MMTMSPPIHAGGFFYITAVKKGVPRFRNKVPQKNLRRTDRATRQMVAALDGS
jgi:hypothetical protein